MRRRLAPARRAVVSAPATFCYLAALAVTSAMLSLSSDATKDRLLSAVSTNLHQLGRVPVRTLVGSAFWVGGWGALFLWAVLLAAVLAPVERRLGWRRTVLVFAAGHLGATLLVAAGLWVGLRLDAVDPAVAHARDVGASYGFLAVAALAGYLLAPRLRLAYVGALAVYVLAAAAIGTTFTDVGHLLAVTIGLACYPLARRPAATRLRA